ncbi:hypothetical protein EIN_315780 [Entamoeba invadens IP1]|uniref:Fungal lipase-type domain-containing protein n=1 Tax=Entamoeba invadens IP1 TaxID=370355 RepID=A0A0A1TZE6_ENTIV|nr:hypothetical protein EIN_315780 [Entamoeba invadens IP1]ELP86939.1 hypothetical protein EIN_315780 [Entamoeba invadens IP1]|eukprot:XP_004253710.1 hypothetical protein EIN_315780 [Entamoeba invadens IP1]
MAFFNSLVNMGSSLFFELNNLAYSISIAVLFQLLFFTTVMLFGICVIFITSVSYLFSESYYIILLIYGFFLSVILLYRYFLFSVEYFSKTLEQYSIWKMKLVPENRKNASAALVRLIRSYKLPQMNGVISVIARIVLVITDNFNLLIFNIAFVVILTAIITKAFYTTILINTIGYTYLLFGWVSLTFYFVAVIVVDFIFEVIKTYKEKGKVNWLRVVPLCLPCSFVFWFFGKVLDHPKRIKPIFRVVVLWVVTFMLVAFVLVFLFSLIMVTVDSAKYNTTMVCYWLLFIIAMITGLIPATEDLKIQQKEDKKEQEEYIVLMNQDEDLDFVMGVEKPPEEYIPTSYFDVFEQVRQRICGFEFKHSAFLVEVFCGILLLLVVFETSTLSSLLKTSPSENSNLPDKNTAFAKFRTETILWGDWMNVGLKENSKGTATNYAIEYSHLCSSDAYGITPNEYSFLSYMAYHDNNIIPANTTYATIYGFLKERGWSLEYHLEADVLHYLVATNSKSGVVVVSFRGTYSLDDCVHDLQLFVESIIPSLSTTIFPMFTDQVLSWISYALSYFGSRAFPRGSLYLIDIAKDVVVKLQKEVGPQTKVVLAGHSLGGGIANIVGALVGLNSFGVSPPGIFYGRKSLGLTKQELTVTSRGIIPERDPVANSGENGGLIMRIPCYKDKVSCHDIGITVCMIGGLCNETEMSVLCQADWDEWGF